MDIYIGKRLNYIDSFGFIQKNGVVFSIIDNKKFMVHSGLIHPPQDDMSITELDIKDENKLFWEIKEGD